MKWLYIWRASAELTIKLRIKFFALRLMRARLFQPLDARIGSSLDQYLSECPQILGAALWPYQCVSWSAEYRLHRIAGHFEAVDRQDNALGFGVEDKLVLLNLTEISPGVRIILDQAKWLMREGALVLNIFVGDLRAYSLAFSLYEDKGVLEAFIGGIQGRNVPHALDLYRTLTKDFSGMRPRDLLIEIFRLLASQMGVTQIRAVRDEKRVARHRYFRATTGELPLAANYNELWKDRGGTAHDDDSFLLPLVSQRRQIGDIPSKKRATYRNRYAFLDRLPGNLKQCLECPQIIRFSAK